MIDGVEVLSDLSRLLGACTSDKARFFDRIDDQWQGLSPVQFSSEVSALARGLRATGVKQGQTVGLWAPSSARWLIMDQAILSCGAVSVPLFTNVSAANFSYQLKDADIHCLLIDNRHESVVTPELMKVLQDQSALKMITLGDCIGGEGLDCQTYATVILDGQSVDEQQNTALKINEDDVATIIYTSGSTGVPKGVMLSHRNLISQLIATAKRFALDGETDVALSCLPLAHIFERMVMYFYVSREIKIYFADDIQNVGALMRECHPTVVTMVPRLLEKLQARFADGVNSLSGFRGVLARWAYGFASDTSYSMGGIGGVLANKILFTKLRAALGGHVRWIIAGGAKLDDDLCRFFIAVGLPVYQGYGQTESSPVISVNYEGHNKPGSVGQIFDGVEVKIENDGHILARGPNIMKGFLGKDEETAKRIDAEGWLKTGDLGNVDEQGYLYITGRAKELYKSSNGKYVSPVPIEIALCKSPLVDMAMVVAENHRFVSALIFVSLPDFDDLKNKAGCAKLERDDFVGQPACEAAIGALLEKVNGPLNHWEQVRKVKLIFETPSIESGEITPTLKIRRHVIDEKYKTIINQFYDS